MSSTITNPIYANTTISSAGASSGSGLTYTNGTGVTWADPFSNQASGVIHAKDFVIDGELSLKEVLEQRLNMLVPNPEMEKEWAELKQIGDAYRKLEQECIEKSKIWKTLKKK